ncbi:AraC family transcriptional regulator [Granulicella sp. dw_53]|uniref:AraC family transcriptional regulator n=1 Tax=Granulicella sp. dw_53 TaxID=2719792 RepID=UPI001BD1BFD2|nr:AraC family transcriptional regulator [Granulicella sp. dw_53]
MAETFDRLTGTVAAQEAAMSKRVSVLVGNRSVPLLPGSPVTDSSRSPWNGLNLERHSLEAVEIPVHEHPTLCLHLQTSGPVEMDWDSSGRSGHVRSGAGDLILLAPGTKDSLLWYGPSQRIVVSVAPALLGQASSQLGLKTHYDFENNWSFQDEQLRLLLTEMDREMSSGWPMGSLYGDLLSMSLSIALVKKYNHLATIPAPIKGGLSRPNLRIVLAYIEENLEQDIRLEELASLSGLSLFHFARSFRESLGQTPHQYIVQMRVERAKALLSRPEWNIEQIANAVGLASAGRFAKVFRAATGVTPSQWRKNS